MEICLQRNSLLIWTLNSITLALKLKKLCDFCGKKLKYDYRKRYH
jgi:hypothetical protein